MNIKEYGSYVDFMQGLALHAWPLGIALALLILLEIAKMLEGAILHMKKQQVYQPAKAAPKTPERSPQTPTSAKPHHTEAEQNTEHHDHAPRKIVDKLNEKKKEEEEGLQFFKINS